MTLNDLLLASSVDPFRTLVFRHRPKEPDFRKALPLLAGRRPDLLDAYQSYQSTIVEHSLRKRVGGWLASFLAYGGGKAVFVGIYEIASFRPINRDEFWAMPAHQELRQFGCPGWRDEEGRSIRQLFDLKTTNHYAHWRGKLVVTWPGLEKSWFRLAENNAFSIHSILEDSAFTAVVPQWRDIDFSWAELAILPNRTQAALEQWRGIYLIWDSCDGLGYVGSAYGSANILGRWKDYAATGHGGNSLLRLRNPTTFRFTILERVSPDMDQTDVVRLENSWKARLHTRHPGGLNEN